MYGPLRFLACSLALLGLMAAASVTFSLIDIFLGRLGRPIAPSM